MKVGCPIIKMNEKALERRRQNKARIVSHTPHRKQVSKPELAIELGLSMPTILQNVKELQKAGIVERVGEYKFMDGRKAKALFVVKNMRYVTGADIMTNRISAMIIDLRGDIVRSRRFRRRFESTAEYYEDLTVKLEQFLSESRVSKKKILGTGTSLPGTVDRESNWLVRFHIPQVSDIDPEVISRLIPYPVHFENDANSAAVVEFQGTDRNTACFSLNNTVDGSIYLDNDIYGGGHFHGAESGHMIIYPEGRLYYCGKHRYADSCCPTGVLSSLAGEDGGLAEFLRLVEKKERDAVAVWDIYLEDLSIATTNLRMCLDCDIVLGGYVGGYLKPYMSQLNRKVVVNNKFDSDTLCLRSHRYEKEASAVGVAIAFIDKHFRTII